ncbi:MAG: hypothetical protein ABWY94_10830 [Pseudoxanthomonas sp.]
MRTRALLATVAVAEALAGCGLLVVPSIIARLLIGQPLSDGAGSIVGRVAGAAMVSLALACWLESRSTRLHRPAGLLTGLLFYNIAVPLVLLHGHFLQGANGGGLWAATGVHLALAAWIAACLFARPAAHTL